MHNRTSRRRKRWLAFALCAGLSVAWPAFADDLGSPVKIQPSRQPSEAALSLPSKDAAQGWAKLTSHALLTPIVLVGTGSACVLMTYDLNGNRTAQSVVTLGSTGAMWGSSSFGCFIWK